MNKLVQATELSMGMRDGRTTKQEAKFAETDAGDDPRRFRAKSQRG